MSEPSNEPINNIQESLRTKTEVIASTELAKAVNNLAGYKHPDHFASLVSFMTQNLTGIINNREYYFQELSNYRQNYIVNGIYDIILNDVFVDSGTDDYITIKVPNKPEVEEELTKMFAKLNLGTFLMSVFPDLLHYGSYYVRPIIKPGVGIVDLVDDLEPKAVIAITDSKNDPLLYFVSNMLNMRNDTIGTINQGFNTKVNTEYLDITQLISFNVDLSFTKLKLPAKIEKNLRSAAPDEMTRKLLPTNLRLKTSSSLVWPVLDKLKELLLLDKLSVYRDIGSILTPNLVGIPVPDVYSPAELVDVVKRFDELLNSSVVKMNNTQNMELMLQELASVKVIPVVGNRSTPTNIDIGRSQPISNPQSFADGLSRLLNSIGIPKELFDGSIDSKSNLKTNIRYAKKIKRIQKSLARTLVYLCLLHIAEKFPSLDIYEDDITIQLKNSNNLDEMEQQETQDLMVSSIASIKTLVEDLEILVSKSNYEIDQDELVNSIKENFAAVGSRFSNIFKKREVHTSAIYSDPNVLLNPEEEFSQDVPNFNNS